MRETRFIAFNFGSDDLPKAREILHRFGLSGVADLKTEGPVTGYGSVRLDATDPRLNLFLDELRKAGQNPRPRADRVYTRAELGRFPWLRMIVATAGLMGGAKVGQPYDQANTCPKCGSRAAPIPPLIADLSRMGKKKLDATAHDGLLVVTSGLASAITEAGLSGAEFLPVRRRSQGHPDPDVLWMRLTFEWPPMQSTSIFEADIPCSVSGRAGHFDSWSQASEFHYRSVPTRVTDFGHTWEHWGVWKNSQVGGARHVIVSQEARQGLLAQKAHRLRNEPIWIDER
jgi:hypothetical protein